MKQAKFAMGQSVWAFRDIGRWGEPIGVKGTITGILPSLTSGSYLYTIKQDVYSDSIVQLWERELSSINKD